MRRYAISRLFVRSLDLIRPTQHVVLSPFETYHRVISCTLTHTNTFSSPHSKMHVSFFSNSSSPMSTTTKEFRLAQTGEGIKECELLQWFVNQGDTIEEYTPICQVQSDKATIDITSPFSGVISELKHTPGDIVQVGDVLANIHTTLSDENSSRKPCIDTLQNKEENKEGNKGYSMSSPSLDTLDVSASPAARHLARQYNINLSMLQSLKGRDSKITKDDVVAYLNDKISNSNSNNTPIKKDDVVAYLNDTTINTTINTTPHTKNGSAFSMGSLHDEHYHHQGNKDEDHEKNSTQVHQRHANDKEKEEKEKETNINDSIIPLRGYRRAMVKSMSIAATLPHFHLCDEVRVDALVDMRHRLRDAAVLGGTKLTYLPFFLKAAALSLREHPLLNSSLSEDGTMVIQHGRVHIGVAVATPHGLAVPNIKDVDKKSIAAIALEMSRLQIAAANNQLHPCDVQGATFTISNIGTVGGIYCTPLVNVPEAAIMALGRIQQLPRISSDTSTIEHAHILTLSLGADHRIVDGAALAGFAGTFKSLIEDPGLLILQLS